MTEKTWFLIPVLAAVSAISMGIAINTSLQLENTEAELTKALTSSDEYHMIVIPATVHTANVTVVNWPTFNATTLKTPLTIEVIMPLGAEPIYEVNRNQLAYSTTYTVQTHADPREGVSIIKFDTTSADNFDILLGQTYYRPVSGTAFITMWSDGSKVSEPVNIFLDRETNFVLRVNIETTNKAN